jgi:16S rRNA (cytosine967-C5)-methyltransferase
LVRRCLKLLGREGAEAFLLGNNEAVETTVQWNPLRDSEEALLQEWKEGGVTAAPHPWLSGCYTLSKTGDLEEMPSFRGGRFLVQDAAAKLAALSAGAAPGMRVLDLCAAPGGKSFALAMEMGNEGNIESFDLHPSKVRLILEGAKRLGITCIRAESGDAKQFCPALEHCADIVLCDVPCSGLGVIRKKPDIRFKREEELSGLPRVQGAILANAARYVRPGGVLLYSTCTILPEENEGVCEAFLRQHGDFSREAFTLPAPIGRVEAGQITLWPQCHGTDGFYICRMRKL